MFKKILCLLVAFSMVFSLAACNCNGDGDDGGDVGNVQTPPVQDSRPQVEVSTDVKPTYGIYFYTGNTSKVSPMLNIKAGSKITAPEDPSFARNEFLGWFTDYGTFKNKFVWDTMPANDVVLYANWKPLVDDGELSEYEQALDAKSENGHLYIHYLRFDNNPEEYAKMSLWVWPKAYTGKTFNWEKGDDGKVIVDEVGGAVCDIDLTLQYDKAGNDETETMQFFTDDALGAKYEPEYIKDETKYLDKEIGFLIVYDESKNSGSHWKSDGGNQYFKISAAVRDNGAIHVFAVQDNVNDFVFRVAEKGEISNPYDNDDGTNVSKADVNSSVDLPATADPKNIFDTVSGVGYQIMVASYADSNGDGYGDIRGIIENLDYLDNFLNVDVLWLTPIQLSDSYHGYDIIDYCSVDPKFGTMDDYKELLEECHKRGMKVVMDLVLNHTSINNVWFQKSAKMAVENGIDYRSFYHWRNHETTKLSESWYPYSEYSYSYYAKFASSMPELNYDYQATRDAILDVARFWMTLLDGDSGVDGFRIDAVKHIYMADEVTAASGDVIINDYDEATKTDYSTNVTKNLNFFCWLIDGIKKINANAYVVGENFDGHAYNVAPYYKAFDGMLDFYMYYNLAQVAGHWGWAYGIAGGANTSSGTFNGVNTDKLYTSYWNYNDVMKTAARYGNQVSGSLFTSNHDIPRLINNVGGKGDKEWVANMNMTESAAVEAKKRALTTITALMTLPGVSWIYYGDELGMSGNYGAGESKTSPHVDRQYRQPFKWTTDKKDSKYITGYTIPGDKTYSVEWDSYNKTLAGAKEQMDAKNGSFLQEVAKWTKLKSTDDVIRYGSYEPCMFGGNGDIFSFKRSYNGTTYWVICNFGISEYGNPGKVFGNGAQLIEASEGASMNYLPVGGSMVVKVAG